MIIREPGLYVLRSALRTRGTISVSIIPAGTPFPITQVDTAGQRVIGPDLEDWIGWDIDAEPAPPSPSPSSAAPPPPDDVLDLDTIRPPDGPFISMHERCVPVSEVLALAEEYEQLPTTHVRGPISVHGPSIAARLRALAATAAAPPSPSTVDADVPEVEFHPRAIELAHARAARDEARAELSSSLARIEEARDRYAAEAESLRRELNATRTDRNAQLRAKDAAYQTEAASLQRELDGAKAGERIATESAARYLRHVERAERELSEARGALADCADLLDAAAAQYAEVMLPGGASKCRGTASRARALSSAPAAPPEPASPAWRPILEELRHRHRVLARSKVMGLLSGDGDAELERIRSALDGIDAAQRAAPAPTAAPGDDARAVGSGYVVPASTRRAPGAKPIHSAAPTPQPAGTPSTDKETP